MGCQKTIAEKIRSKEADYLLALKGNHGDLNDDIRTYFNGEIGANLDIYKSYDKGHGRIEIRQYKVSKDIECLEQKNEWKDLKCIIEVESIRIIKNKETNEKRYFISSLEGTAEEIGKAIRSHWSVENQLHWVLDVTFNRLLSKLKFLVYCCCLNFRR